MAAAVKAPKLISMKRTPADKRKDAGECAPIDCIAPDYPYGLVINLDSDELDKLGLTELPKVGTEIPITVKVRVTRVMAAEEENSKGDSDERRNMSLQITDMALG